MKNIGILGSTGSVGSQTLEVIRNNKEKFNIVFLSAHNNKDLLLQQAKEFKPKYICLSDKKNKIEYVDKIDGIHILYGKNGIIELRKNDNCDIILNAIN